jgi:plasmid stability protein
MAVMIQIRNVPNALHRELKTRASRAGMSLSDYLTAELREVAARPTMEEMRERLGLRAPAVLTLTLTPAEALRLRRDG